MDDTIAADEGAEAFLRLDRAAKQAGASIAAALSAGQTEGRKLDDVLRDVGQRLGSMAIQAGAHSLAGTLTSALGSTLTGAAGSALGGAGFAAPAALADLGAVASAAPAAAISSPIQQSMRPAAVSVTIQTPDAESFRRSEAQVAAALSRAVQRGQRGL